MLKSSNEPRHCIEKVQNLKKKKQNKQTKAADTESLFCFFQFKFCTFLIQWRGSLLDFNILLFAQVHLRMNLTNVVSSQLLHSKKKKQINKRKILFKGIKTHSSQSSKAWEILRQSKVTYIQFRISIVLIFHQKQISMYWHLEPAKDAGWHECTGDWKIGSY